MTCYVGFANLDNWDQALDIDTHGPDGEWVPFVSLPRAGAQSLHVGDGQEIICRIRLGKKGEDYGRFLGDLSHLVIPAGPQERADRTDLPPGRRMYEKYVAGERLPNRWPAWDDLTPDRQQKWEALTMPTDERAPEAGHADPAD